MIVRPDRQAAGKELVKIAAGNHIVAVQVFLLQQIHQLSGLSDFTLAVVIGLQVQVHQDQLFLAAFDGQAADQQTALEVGRAHRPCEGAGERHAFRLADFIIGRGQQTAVNLSQGRPGNRNKGTGIIQRIGRNSL